MDMTAEQVEAAAKGATTLTQVARSLGIKEKKLSGRTATRLRSILPDLDEILKGNRTETPASQAPKHSEKILQKPASQPNPYREGSMYAALYAAGASRFWIKQELIAHVSKMVGKEERLVGYQIPVLGNPRQKSNQGRSTLIKDAQGRIKFVACKGKSQ